MKIVFNNSQKLNDIVFAKRNKSYGAYALRSAYGNTVLKSLSIVSSTVFLLAIGAYTFNKLNIEKEVPYLGTNDSVRVIQWDTKPEEPEKKPEQKKTAAAPKAEQAATVVKDSAEAKPSPTNDQIMNNGLPDGDPNAIAGNSPTGPITETVESTPTPTVAEPTAFPDMDPEFEGGLKALREFIAKNVQYPGLAREAGQEGTVHVTFIINEEGIVENSKVLKGIGYGCDEESVRVINKIPKFKKPGRNKFGQAIKTIFTIPIAFRLRN